MKRLFLATSALCCASAVTAFPVPPDIAAVSGPSGYTAVTPQYKTDGTANTTIDPTVTPPPAYSYELTNIPIPSDTGRVITTAAQGPGSPYCTVIADGGTCNEYKFRTIIDQTYMLPDDPVRNYGQSGSSHLHCFFGGGSVNAFSTYKTLRQHALDSVAGGADANGTGYWRPCTTVLNPYGDGLNYAIRDDFETVYYVGTIGKKQAHYPVGLRYVFGFDMDASSTTTQFAWLQTILNAANAAQGSTRYTLTNPSTGTYENQASYVCAGATPSSVRVLVNSDGSDPYGGTCASGATFDTAIDGPKCWDGTNLWSPGGYKHVIPGVWDTLVSAFVCPYNYYLVPFLRIEFVQTQYGWTDRQRWALSSDIAYRTAHGLTSTTLPAGTTFHTDWEYGWDSAIFLQALKNCAGVDGVQGHECNSSYFSSTQHLVVGVGDGTGAGGRNPQTTSSSLDHTLQTGAGWMLIPPAWSGALTNMHMHN